MAWTRGAEGGAGGGAGERGRRGARDRRRRHQPRLRDLARPTAGGCSPRRTTGRRAGCSRPRRAASRWLAEAGALRIPEVVAVARAGRPRQFLVLELVATGAPARDFDERLGRGLAALHRHGAPGFGLDHDNFIGWLPQSNAAAPTWAEFYRTRRLEPQLRRAADGGLASSRMRQGFERLFGALEELVRPARAAGAPARRPVGRQPALRRSRRARASSTRPSTAATARSIWR